MTATEQTSQVSVSGQEAYPSLEQFGGMLKSRRTVNFFRSKPVPANLLEQAIEVARWAPNHKLTEPWHFYLPGDETIEQIRQLIVELKAGHKNDEARQLVRSRLDAIPGWFIVTCRLSPDMALRQQEDYAACACAVQNLMLYLWQAGVGVKWTSGQVIRDERLYRILGIEETSEFVVGLFWYGYPDDSPPEQKRRDTEDICTRLP